MAVRQTIWVADDRERRQRISQEVQQLRTMSKSLRTSAMRSFMKRLSAPHEDVKRKKAPVKPTSIAA